MTPRSHPRTHRLGLLPAALAIALATMTPAWAADDAARSFTDMVAQVALPPQDQADSEMLAKAGAAIGFIKKMDLPHAQQAINEALQLDARNSYLHFLNGFVYHLQAKQGDTQKGEMAIEGYQQALRIDPANWIAQEFLGLAYMDLKQFERAKGQFTQVLLMTPDSTVSIEGLMVAAYLTGDAATACAMADQFLKTTAKPHTGFVRSSISAYASCGNFAQADKMRALLGQIGDGAADAERADRRVARWKAFYQRQAAKASSNQDKATADAIFVKASLTREQQDAQDALPERLAQAFTLPKMNRPPADDTPPPAPVRPSATPDQASAQDAAPTPPSPSPTPDPSAASNSNGPRMLLIDVVLLSTQELIGTSKGVNLLSALTLQLNPYVRNYEHRTDSTNNYNTTTTTLTRGVTIPSLTYSLNIANASNSVNEVLARPTLAAIEGQSSEFFSGTNLSAGVVSLSQQGGATIVPLDKRFGIKLAVTPTFLASGQVQLKVDAQRTSLNASSDNPKVAYQIEIGEITANANVVMKMGDTLVLSGLSEKTSSSTRDGVPGLQDIPLVQYLFSNQKTNDIQRSVLILVTPRAPVQAAESAREAAPTAMADNMRMLRERFGMSETVPSNLEAIVNQMKPNDYFREFRQGDVSMERWDRMRTTGERLREALGFLYY